MEVLLPLSGHNIATSSEYEKRFLKYFLIFLIFFMHFGIYCFYHTYIHIQNEIKTSIIFLCNIIGTKIITKISSPNVYMENNGQSENKKGALFLKKRAPSSGIMFQSLFFIENGCLVFSRTSLQRDPSISTWLRFDTATLIGT